MGENLRLARPFFVLLAVFAAGRLSLSLSGVPYAQGTNVFSIVILTLFSCAYYGVFLRRWRSYRLIQAILLGFLLGRDQPARDPRRTAALLRAFRYRPTSTIPRR